MLHDVLINLLSEENSNGISDWLSVSKTFLHPGEALILQEILNIGSKYKEINKFISKTLDGCEDGTYCKAFCRGLECVLNEYKRDVLQLDMELVDNHQFTLSYIYAELNSYDFIFTELLGIITKISEAQTRGTMFFGALNLFLVSLSPPLNEVLSSILKPVNEVFYENIAQWMIYGIIKDAYKEFFICDSGTADDFFQQETLHSGHKPIIKNVRIKYDLLPSVIDAKAANLILLSGQLVWILNNKPNNFSVRNKETWMGKDLELYHKIKCLQDEAFCSERFNRTLNECKTIFCERLYSVMVNEANVMDHFQMIRDYYTLGRGALFQRFVETCVEKEKPGTADLRLLNVEFRETIAALYGTTDKSHRRFELRLTDGSNDDDSQVLSLNFNVEWPLHIVFHPKSLESYNKLFSYLLRLKRANVNLCKLWFVHNKQRVVNHKLAKLRHNLKVFVDRVEYYLQVEVIETSFFALKTAVQSDTAHFETILHAHVDFVGAILSRSFVTSSESIIDKSVDLMHRWPNVKCTSGVHTAIVDLLNLSDDFCADTFEWPSDLTDEHLEELDRYSRRGNAILDRLKSQIREAFDTMRASYLIKLGFTLEIMKL